MYPIIPIMPLMDRSDHVRLPAYVRGLACKEICGIEKR